jgi:hypothetical protein
LEAVDGETVGEDVVKKYKWFGLVRGGQKIVDYTGPVFAPVLALVPNKPACTKTS